MTTFSADRDKHEAGREKIGSTMERQSPINAFNQRPPAPTLSTSPRGADDLKTSLEKSDGCSRGRFRSQSDHVAGEAVFSGFLPGLGRVGNERSSENSMWVDDDSSSSSQIDLPHRSFSEIELSNGEGNDADKRGVKTGRLNCNRFDTGFWEDESNFSPECGIDNVHVKGQPVKSKRTTPTSKALVR